MKKISIITPSYNQGQYLEQTIDGVLSQQYPDLEYIIIDGGSTDNSVEIIKKYEKHLKYWVSEKDKGQSDAINKGMKMASGEIVNWLNSDDWYNPGTLQKIADYFEDEKILVVSGRGDVWKDGELVSRNPGVDLYPFFEKTAGWARIDQPETFFRRSAIQKIGYLNTDLHYVMDREWWIRFLFHFGESNILKVEDTFVNFRLHEGSKSFKYRDLFEQEANNVYYTIAQQNELPEAGPFKKYFPVETIDTLSYRNIAGKDSLRKIIHYFWLLQGSMNYAANNMETARNYFQIIDGSLLRAEDAEEWNKLKTRAAWIPLWLKKLLNKRLN
jgi:glycosyltransferase involved in cell wall biosynthesis